MIDHLELCVADVSASIPFYAGALVPLGYSQHATGNPAGFGTDPVAPDFWIRAGGPAQPLPHVAFRCATREQVHRCYEAALASGGRSRLEPTLMPRVHASYYAAQVLDPDGHNIEFACHQG